MPVYRLTRALAFPPPEKASDEGLLAIGGDFSPERLILAYSQGIFPWPHQDAPLLWFSPDPRFVLLPSQVHLHKSLRKQIRRAPYSIRFDTAFETVIRACARAPRPGQDGTWITDDLIAGYEQLFRSGFAHSIEAWRGDTLVGGLYGVSLGRMFFGESMFAEEEDASKIAFATLVAHLRRWDFAAIDCQVPTDHLARFGAERLTRKDFLALLRNAVGAPTRIGPWVCELSPESVLQTLSSSGDMS